MMKAELLHSDCQIHRQEDLASHPLQRTVINMMSARRLTPVEEDVLALGLNFAVVPRVLPKEEFVQRLEPKLYHMTNDAASNICVQITEVLRRAMLPASNLTKNKKDALRNLRADKSIHILKADKGNATVILDRLEYDNKILALLRLLHMMNVRFSLLNMVHRILGVTLPNF
jgi:hypothetical protein